MAQNALMNFLQAASNTTASNVSAPVDGIAWLLRKAGIPVPANALGGSQWMAEQGLTKPVQQGTSQVLGDTLVLLSPAAVQAAAPKIAAGLLAAEGAGKRGAMAVGQRGADIAENYMAQNGLMQMAQPSGTWFKGMHPHDWTKETSTFEGPLLDPKNIRRTSPFPTYGGEKDSLEGVRGFFSADPEVASRFSRLSNRGAVYPVNLEYSKPYVIDAGGKRAAEIQFGKGGADFQRAVSSGKYDAVIIKNTADEGDVAVLLEGGNVKSVWDK